MSYLTEQKTELAQAQVTEALLRMSKLQIHSNAIKEFLESGKLNRSERGILYWLEQDEEKMVREWEKETGNMVYHVSFLQGTQEIHRLLLSCPCRNNEVAERFLSSGRRNEERQTP